MNQQTVRIVRSPLVLAPDRKRVLLRPFVPGSHEKAARIVACVLALPEEQVISLLSDVEKDFAERHRNLRGRFLERFEQVKKYLPDRTNPSEAKKLLIGSYFLAEYSLESAALFNPSIVPDPDQSGLPPGALRFILSLRATGEGHISSIIFRSGVVAADGSIATEKPTGCLVEPEQITGGRYAKATFLRKLSDMDLAGQFSTSIVNGLGDSFTMDELRAALDAARTFTEDDTKTSNAVWMMARSNFEVQFGAGDNLSERVLFPATPSQRNGMEDARFVRFADDDGTFMYYATFTAYDGRVILPEMVETRDFLRFRFTSLNGPAAKNKGMALFPRKIDGCYAMLSRQDNENIDLMFSDNVHFWHDRSQLLKPLYPWELVQIGNCGSPIETEAGWLVLSHGVGPVRQYSIGVFLLDLKDPRKVIGRLKEPLIRPNQADREGYVPNVVYSCGAMLHGEDLIVPYGLADYSTVFASMKLNEVLSAMG